MTQHLPERRGEGSLDISSYDGGDDKHSNMSDNSAKEDLARYISELKDRPARRVSPRKATYRESTPSESSYDDNEMTYKGNLVNSNTVPV